MQMSRIGKEPDDSSEYLGLHSRWGPGEITIGRLEVNSIDQA
ncbi:hypothetical protein ACVMB1_000186 [Bradyrhizobium sp. USDA 4504]